MNEQLIGAHRTRWARAGWELSRVILTEGWDGPDPRSQLRLAVSWANRAMLARRGGTWLILSRRAR